MQILSSSWWDARGWPLCAPRRGNLRKVWCFDADELLVIRSESSRQDQIRQHGLKGVWLLVTCTRRSSESRCLLLLFLVPAWGSVLWFFPSLPDWRLSSEARQLASLGSLLDDQQWHHVLLERQGIHLNLTMDKHTETAQIPAGFSHWDIEEVQWNRAILRHTITAQIVFESLSVFLNSWVWEEDRASTHTRRTSTAAWRTCSTTTSTWYNSLNTMPPRSQQW